MFVSVSGIDIYQHIYIQDAVRSLVNIYPLLLDDLSPRRVEIIDAASATSTSLCVPYLLFVHHIFWEVESQSRDREKSRKKLLKAAKSDFLRGLERQKVRQYEMSV